MLHVWTDGACVPNPGRGGWAWITRCGKQASGRDPQTTNQRMEMTAALEALRSLPGQDLLIHSDSQYLIKGMTEWLDGWIGKGWRTRTGPVKNMDLWQDLIAAAAGRRVSWKWVRGHSGNVMNERADSLAVAAACSHPQKNRNP